MVRQGEIPDRIWKYCWKNWKIMCSPGLKSGPKFDQWKKNRNFKSMYGSWKRRKRSVSSDGSYRWWKDDCIVSICVKTCSFHHMDHIIYVIPYTSIIEQNAEVFRNILGEENVLEHHCNVDYDSSEDLKPMQLASENWDKPVIVTTSVQFLIDFLLIHRPSAESFIILQIRL